MNNRRYLIAFLFIVILISSVTSAYAVDNPDGETYVVAIQNGKFNLSNIEVGVGDTVEWINKDPISHDFYLFGRYEPDLKGGLVLHHADLPTGILIKYLFDYEGITRAFGSETLTGVRYCLSQECSGTINLKIEAFKELEQALEISSNEPETTVEETPLPPSPTEEVKFSTPTNNEQLTAIEEQAPIFPSKSKTYFLIGLAILIALVASGYGLWAIYGLRTITKRLEKEVKTETKEVEVEEKKKVNFDIKEVISVSNFTLKYGQKTILENVSFEINKGEMVCLLGPSGTGKSTIIEALVGRKTPTKGILKILGRDISKDRNIFDYVGFVPQHAELYMNQTVEQNLLSSATKWGIKNAKEKAEKILLKIDLSHRKDLKASKLSGGQQKLLSLGMELIRDIEVCILDEPTTGLDPNTRNNIITILSHISSQMHKTIFFTTHFMDDAEECDNVIILADKRIVAQGPPSKLERMLPGGGRVVSIVLDNVTEDLIEKIENLEGVKKVIREGRTLKIISNEPNAVQMGHKIDGIGGSVNEVKIERATIMEVFVYHTGKKPE